MVHNIKNTLDTFVDNFLDFDITLTPKWLPKNQPWSVHNGILLLRWPLLRLQLLSGSMAAGAASGEVQIIEWSCEDWVEGLSGAARKRDDSPIDYKVQTIDVVDFFCCDIL